MGSDEKGFAAYYERRLLERYASRSAAQAPLADAPGVTRYIWGGVGKFYLQPLRTLFLAEVDVAHLCVRRRRGRPAHADDRARRASPCCRCAGVIVTVLGERNQVDVEVRDAAWTALRPAGQLVSLSRTSRCR